MRVEEFKALADEVVTAGTAVAVVCTTTASVAGGGGGSGGKVSFSMGVAIAIASGAAVQDSTMFSMLCAVEASPMTTLFTSSSSIGLRLTTRPSMPIDMCDRARARGRGGEDDRGKMRAWTRLVLLAVQVV